MKKKWGKGLLTICLTAAMVISGLGVTPKQAEAAATKFTGTHFEDGFDYYDTGKWHKAADYTNGDMFYCTWREANIAFNNGKMEMAIKSDNWQTEYSRYSGAEYRTNQAFHYGMYQVNMKPAKNDGIVTSFFTYTGPSDGTNWDEIDIEFLGKDTTKVQFNYYSNGVGGHEYVHNLGFDASQGYHTYGFYWAPDAITWYVDGKEVYKTPSYLASTIPDEPSRIMMNLWPSTGVDDWLNHYNGRAPLYAYYDWTSWDAPEGNSSSGSTNNNTGNNNTSSNNNANAGTTTVPTVGSNFTIEAEKYTYMQGVEAAGGVIGYIDPGDWMSYEINVQTAGTYSVEFSLASAQGSSFRLEKNSGKELLANVKVPNTGDWGKYQSVWADVYLTAGKNNIAIATDQGAFNIDKMEFSLKNGNTTTSNNSNNNNNNNTNSNTSSGLEGVYYIKNVHSGKYLDVANGSNANSANIQQWDFNGGNAQKFKLVSNGNGSYRILTGASNYSKCVDVAGAKSADGTNILQYSYGGGSNQQFKLQRQSDGSYAILTGITNYTGGLDVYNWSMSAGGNVVQWNFWGGNCQKWILERTN